MRQLRFVRTAEDGTHLLVETTDGAEQFRLSNDAALREAARAELPHLPGASPAVPAEPVPGPAVTARAQDIAVGPREIQVRVRAGESPQDLADSYGVGVERIMRFAGPVLDERIRIADEARRARARRSTADGTESKLVAFGEAVDGRFGAHGIDPAEVTWDSRRRDDGEWVIRAEWLGGESRHSAEWLFHRSSRSISPTDDTAEDLLSDRPIRPVTPPVEAPQPSLAAAPPLAPGIVAFPPMPDAHTGPLPRIEDVFDQEAPPDGPRSVPPLPPASMTPPPVPAATGAVTGAPAGEDTLSFDAPPLPLGITDPSTRPGAAVPGFARLRNIGRDKREESEEERAARARVPSWDDILLGVRRKQD